MATVWAGVTAWEWTTGAAYTVTTTCICTAAIGNITTWTYVVPTGAVFPQEGIVWDVTPSYVVTNNPVPAADWGHVAAAEVAEQGRARREATWRDGFEQRQAALERSKDLLLSCLSAAQKAMFDEHGMFEVESPSHRRYCIRALEQDGRHGNITELAEDGSQVAWLCCAPGGDIPHYDAILGQKLFLEYDEAGFQQRANVTRAIGAGR